MNDIKKWIITLNTTRDIALSKYLDSYDEKPDNYLDTDSDVDNIGSKILELIKQYKEILEFEFIFEQLVKLGQSPSLLYDDDGHFAMVTDGYQSVVTDGPMDCELHFYIEKEYWFDTVREALYNYLENLE